MNLVTGRSSLKAGACYNDGSNRGIIRLLRLVDTIIIVKIKRMIDVCL